MDRMPYRDDSNVQHPRHFELLVEIEAVTQRAREYPYLAWKKSELLHELYVLSDGREGALPGQAPKPRAFRTSLRTAGMWTVRVGFTVLVLAVFLGAVIKTIGPQVSKAGSHCSSSPYNPG
jgi:hypothetical protein